jgi:tetratricopeptide (TPR) repeat protein
MSPNYAEAHFVLGTALPAVGRLGEAVDELKKAMSLDPLSPDHSGWLSRFQLYARDFAGAIAQARKTIELDENYVRAYLYIGSAYLGQGESDKALEWFRRGQSLEKSVRSYDALIVLALAKLGRNDEAEEILTRLEEESKRQYIRSEILAMGYAAVGELDKAFASLERAFEARSAGLIYLHVDPGYQPLRADPRFTDLVGRIGLR